MSYLEDYIGERVEEELGNDFHVLVGHYRPKIEPSGNLTGDSKRESRAVKLLEEEIIRTGREIVIRQIVESVFGGMRVVGLRSQIERELDKRRL